MDPKVVLEEKYEEIISNGHVFDDISSFDELWEAILANPSFFVMEGGSDGTFAHVCYRADFGLIHKEIMAAIKHYHGEVEI